MKTQLFTILTLALSVAAVVTAFTQTGKDAKKDADKPAAPPTPVYFMISYDIVNMAEFQQYPPKVMTLLKKYGAEVLASDVQGTVFEGTGKMMNAIIKFPSRDAAVQCYNDPEYAPIKQIRLNSTKNCTMVLVNELVVPVAAK